MSIQNIVFYAGITAFVVATVFGGLALHSFFAQDIPRVMVDLKGRVRGGSQRDLRAAQKTGMDSVSDAKPWKSAQPYQKTNRSHFC